MSVLLSTRFVNNTYFSVKSIFCMQKKKKMESVRTVSSIFLCSGCFQNDRVNSEITRLLSSVVHVVEIGRAHV